MGMFSVTNFEAWGNLVKNWAKGTQAWPASIAELQNQCDAVGAGAQITGYTTLRLEQAASDTELLLRVPPRNFLIASEQNLMQGGNYSIPPFYKRIFNQNDDPQIPPAQNMRVHAERIGDYTMSVCT